MIYFMLTYLLFIMFYEHWGTQSVISHVIYFTFQYAWISVLSLYNARNGHKVAHILFGVIFAGLAVNELLCLDLTQTEYKQSVDAAGPVFGLTVFASALFIIFEIIQWLQRHSGSRGRI